MIFLTLVALFLDIPRLILRDRGKYVKNMEKKFPISAWTV